jgi:hypothetical protein
MRFTAIVLVFALLGPAIGGFSLIAMMAAISLGIDASPSDIATMAVFGMVYGAVIGYLVGLVPAVAIGLIVALWQELIGRVTWAVALGVGLAAGLAFLYFIESGRVANLAPADFPQVHAALVLTCVIPTMLCWLVARALFFRRSAAGIAA